jgi:hypothetical protein
MDDWSASNLSRGMKCPANYELQHSTWKPDGVKRAGYRGTVIHRFLEEVGIGVSYELALDRVPFEYREVCSKIDITEIIPFGAEFEMAFIYKIGTGSVRYLGKGIKRNYGNLDFDDVPGTLDMAYIDEGVLYIRDFKTGKIASEHPSDNKQLLLLSLCASEHFNIEPKDLGIIQIKEDGKHEIFSARIDSWKIEEFEHRMRRMKELRLAAKEKLKNKEPLESPEIKEGEHCRFCPAKNFCPIKNKDKKPRKRKKKNG